MTYRAVVPTGRDDEQQQPVTTSEDVEELITLLSGDDAHAVTIADSEDAPALEAQVHGGYGYLLYSGDGLPVHSVGEPDSPALDQVSEVGFPAGSGLTLDAFRAAVREFVDNGGSLPASVRWRGVEVD